VHKVRLVDQSINQSIGSLLKRCSKSAGLKHAAPKTVKYKHAIIHTHGHSQKIPTEIKRMSNHYALKLNLDVPQ